MISKLQIEVGDVICEIETDKATLEFECLEEGYVLKFMNCFSLGDNFCSKIHFACITC